MSVKDMQENWEPKILVFACNWCTYAGADLAGLSRLQYPPNIRILRVPCSGRSTPVCSQSFSAGYRWCVSSRLSPRRLSLCNRELFHS